MLVGFDEQAAVWSNPFEPHLSHSICTRSGNRVRPVVVHKALFQFNDIVLGWNSADSLRVLFDKYVVVKQCLQVSVTHVSTAQSLSSLC